jgi:hypothetical protein
VLYTQTDLVASDKHNMDNGLDIAMDDAEPETLLSDPDPYVGEDERHRAG